MAKHQSKDLESFIFKAIAQNTKLKSALFKGTMTIEDISKEMVEGYGLKATPSEVKSKLEKYKENCLLR